MIRGIFGFLFFDYFKSLLFPDTPAEASPLTLLVTRIARANDADDAVPFDDLAELTSALDRRSDFHLFTLFDKTAKHAARPPSPPDPAELRRATRSEAELPCAVLHASFAHPRAMRCGGLKFTAKPFGILFVS